MDRLKQKINELRAYTAEEEWFEFKDSWYDEVGIAEYIPQCLMLLQCMEKITHI